MAKARKCDICGRCHDMYNYAVLDGIRYPNAIGFMKRYENDSIRTTKEYDLCPDCLLAIALFIENLKAEKDDKVGIEMLRKSFNLPVVDNIEGE